MISNLELYLLPSGRSSFSVADKRAAKFLLGFRRLFRV
jgi:hypothetical protein